MDKNHGTRQQCWEQEYVVQLRKENYPENNSKLMKQLCFHS